MKTHAVSDAPLTPSIVTWAKRCERVIRTALSGEGSDKTTATPTPAGTPTRPKLGSVVASEINLLHLNILKPRDNEPILLRIYLQNSTCSGEAHLPQGQDSSPEGVPDARVPHRVPLRSKREKPVCEARGRNPSRVTPQCRANPPRASPVSETVCGDRHSGQLSGDHLSVPRRGTPMPVAPHPLRKASLRTSSDGRPELTPLTAAAYSAAANLQAR